MYYLDERKYWGMHGCGSLTNDDHNPIEVRFYYAVNEWRITLYPSTESGCAQIDGSIRHGRTQQSDGTVKLLFSFHTNVLPVGFIDEIFAV